LTIATGLTASVIIFVGLYIVLATERWHRAVVALLAALVVVALGLLPAGAAVRAVDWNTLGLLLGLMLLVTTLEEAGLFLVLARSLRRMAGRSSWRLVVLFLLATALISALLPNVTVILLLGPVLLTAAESAGLPVIPVLVLAVMASNLGGLGTLIGDPPNILIGTEANISFMGFLAAVGPLAALLVLAVLVLGRRWIPRAGPSAAPPAEPPSPRSPMLLGLLAVFVATVIGFVVAPLGGLPLGVVGMAGGLAAVLMAGPDFDEVLGRVDFGTLLFFAGLFVVVGSLEAQGALRMVASWVLNRGAGPWLPLWVMTGVALCSAFVDNIPIVAAAIPLVRIILAEHPTYGPALWFALAIGAAVGGNATVIGASANVVAAGLAKARGYSLSFRQFLAYGVPVAVVTWAVAALYLVVRWGVGR
jgi:Na+/H+ antiporter NhaD/arsenite permease-like protein